MIWGGLRFLFLFILPKIAILGKINGPLTPPPSAPPPPPHFNDEHMARFCPTLCFKGYAPFYSFKIVGGTWLKYYIKKALSAGCTAEFSMNSTCTLHLHVHNICYMYFPYTTETTRKFDTVHMEQKLSRTF